MRKRGGRKKKEDESVEWRESTSRTLRDEVNAAIILKMMPQKHLTLISYIRYEWACMFIGWSEVHSHTSKRCYCYRTVQSAVERMRWRAFNCTNKVILAQWSGRTGWGELFYSTSVSNYWSIWIMRLTKLNLIVSASRGQEEEEEGAGGGDREEEMWVECDIGNLSVHQPDRLCTLALSHSSRCSSFTLNCNNPLSLFLSLCLCYCSNGVRDSCKYTLTCQCWPATAWAMKIAKLL